MDAVLGDLIQVLPVKCRTGVSRHVDRANMLARFRVDGHQFVARGEPHLLTVVGNSVHAIAPRERAEFTDDIGW